MGVSETSINRKKVNYLARKRTNDKQRKIGRTVATIDAKKARQIMLFDRKQKRKEEKKEQKKAAKDSKMQIEWHLYGSTPPPP